MRQRKSEHLNGSKSGLQVAPDKSKMRPLQWLKKGKGFIRPSPGQGPRTVAGFSVLTLAGGKRQQ